MAYRCVHCTKTYGDGTRETLQGCTCGSRFFFYIRDDKLIQDAIIDEQTQQLSPSERKQMEEDVREIVGEQDVDKPVFLDFESISIIKPGKYLLDLTKLFAMNKPRVYKLEDGKYIVDLMTPFKR